MPAGIVVPPEGLDVADAIRNGPAYLVAVWAEWSGDQRQRAVAQAAAAGFVPEGPWGPEDSFPPTFRFIGWAGQEPPVGAGAGAGQLVRDGEGEGAFGQPQDAFAGSNLGVPGLLTRILDAIRDLLAGIADFVRDLLAGVLGGARGILAWILLALAIILAAVLMRRNRRRA
jgi:hypothetical protein